MTEQMPIPDTSENQSFSSISPAMQTGIDSTSLGEFKLCERRWYYGILWGYQPRSGNIHLAFGGFLHDASHHYHLARAEGKEHDEALRLAVAFALRATWRRDLSRPWISDDPSKNRMTLIRALVWYFDQFANDPIETLRFPDGKPAVEIDFKVDSGLRTQANNEPIVLCGRFDRIGRLNDRPHGLDMKTTGWTLNAGYFAQFSPDNQISFYTIAGQMVFQEPLAGFIIDGVQVGANFVRVQRHLVPRSAEGREEWWREFAIWMQRMELAAERRYWTMNDKACHLYGGCAFREVCARPPKAREQWLRADYQRRVWDPINRREDI